MNRPSHGEYAVALAVAAATRSEDPKRKVGASILARDGHVLALGYNGPLSGVEVHPDEWEDREHVKRFTIHAEANALRYVRPGEASLLASTYLPCAECLRTGASMGIRQFWYAEESSPVWRDDSVGIAVLLDLELVYCPPVEWTMSAYQTETERTGSNMRPETAALGLVGEAGEVLEEVLKLLASTARVADVVKKATGHGVPLDTIALMKELGDELWYITQVAQKYGLSMNQIAQANVNKLRKRYPIGFTEGGGIR